MGDYSWLIPVAMAGAQLGGTLIGEANRGAAAGKAEDSAEMVEALYNNPALIEEMLADQQGRSEMDNISTDPRLRQAQMSQLAALEEIAKSGGLRLQDKAMLNEAMGQAAQQERGSREATQQRMQMQGMGNSGMNFAQQMMAQQAGADRQSKASLGVAANAQDRALEAMMRAGKLGGDIRGQDWGEASERARANDDINRFNTSARNAFQLQNRANLFNQTDGRAAGYKGLSGIQAEGGKHQADLWSGLGQGGAQAIGSYGDWKYGKKKE